jgi:thiamine biosynthesis lipoprotein
MSTASVSRRVHVEHVMGTVVSLDVRAGGDDAAVHDAMAWLHEVDRRFSTYREDSEIRRLERGELALSHASADLKAVLARCATLRRETGGVFDVRATGRLDPSALVKGWAAQRAACLLTGSGVTDFCLSAGGDVIARGNALPGRAWRIGIPHPHDRGAIAARVLARDIAVATTGAYERGAHIVDPRTGRPRRACSR